MQFSNVIINGGIFNVNQGGGTFNHYAGSTFDGELTTVSTYGNKTATDRIFFLAQSSKVFQLLRHRGYIDYFAIHRKARLKDTCLWSISNPAIQTWLTSDAPDVSRLWLHGNPGTGKSVLAAFLIEEILTKHNYQDQIVLSYFCKVAGSEKDKAVHVIMAFIRQCLEGHDQFYDVDFTSRFAKYLLGEREDHKFTLEEMEPYLQPFLEVFTKVW